MSFSCASSSSETNWPAPETDRGGQRSNLRKVILRLSDEPSCAFHGTPDIATKADNSAAVRDIGNDVHREPIGRSVTRPPAGRPACPVRGGTSRLES